MDIDKLQGGSNPFKRKGTQYAKDQRAIKKINKANNKKVEKAKKVKPNNIVKPKPFIEKTNEIIRSSVGESIIADWLRKHNVNFYTEKKFKDLTCPHTGNYLRYDFFLPKLKMCIEFDGRQHFKYCRDFDGNDRTLVFKRIERDRLKDRFCVHRGFKMLRIKYTQINSIASILCKHCL